MKNILTFLIISSLLLISSCEKEEVSRIGFETSVTDGSSGTSILKVPDESGKLYLKGTISITSGQLSLELIDPTGLNAYSTTFTALVEAEIDELFDAIKGNWTLKYSSIGGTGSISVHLTE